MVAEKITLRDIQQSEYVQGEEEPNYLITPEQRKVARCNILATIIGKEEVGNITNLVLDDGTAQLVLRSFEPTSLVRALQLGEVIAVIGRVRVYNGERYISPEIVKKTSSLWLKVRQRELAQWKQQESPEEPKIEQELIESGVVPEEGLVVEEQKVKERVEERVIKTIRERDQGTGMGVEELLELFPEGPTELLIEKMQRDGLLFQNLPGRVKVL
jgi:RPA family protein